VVRTGIGQIRWLFDIVFNPQNLIEISSGYTNHSIIRRFKIFTSVTLFFLANVILYALPLSWSGIGFVEKESAHPQFAEFTQPFVNNPDRAWMVLVRLINNAQFLVIFGFLTYVLYHLGIWLTRKSNGLLLSYRVVMINTSIYLAIVFNLAWFAVASDQTIILRDIFDWVFREYFGIFANFLGQPPPWQLESQAPNIGSLSLLGETILIGLFVSLCYYLYVLYMGAIKVHEMTRYEAGIVIGFTLSSPILFGIGSILIELFIDLPPVFTL